MPESESLTPLDFAACPPEPVKDSPVDVLLELAEKDSCPAMDWFRAFVEDRHREIAALYGDTDRKQLSEELCELLAFLNASPHPGITIACLRLCLGREPRSETELAATFGVGKAYVSKIMGLVRDTFGVQPRAGRSEEARRHFAELTRRRIRRDPEAWAGGHPFIGRLAGA